MLRPILLCGAMLILSACGSEPESAPPEASPVFQPTQPAVLSQGSPTKDEDPSVLRAADGTLFVAYFSDRGSNADIYITSTQDGVDWTPAVRVTTDPMADYAPNLFQDDDGTFRLTWFRRQEVMPYYAYARTSRSVDGLTWDEADEREVATAAPIEDWVPSMTRAKDGPLVVYFVSRVRMPPYHKLFAATSTTDGETWNAPVPLDDLNDPTAQDHLPFALRTGDKIAMVWNRYDDTTLVPWEPNPSVDVMYATSDDGLAWTGVVDVTHDDAMGVQDALPALYTDLSGAVFMTWVCTATAAGTVADLAVADIGGYPEGRRQLPLNGYSPRVAATKTPGIYLGVWVQGPIGQQDIYYRFFEK